MAREKVISKKNERPLKPALSPEARENQMISLAMDLVEERLRNGTASSAETVHFLKLATVREQLEREQLAKQNELLTAKTDSIHSAQRTEELYENALKAMRSYSGIDNES